MVKYFIVGRVKSKHEQIIKSFYDLWRAMIYVEAQFDMYELELRIIKGSTNIKESNYDHTK